jgi:hypothetical protein
MKKSTVALKISLELRKHLIAERDIIDAEIKKQEDKFPATIKFNSGRLALLCEECNVIIDEGFPPETYTTACLCNACSNKED